MPSSEEATKVLSWLSEKKRVDLRFIERQKIEDIWYVLNVLHNSEQKSLLEISRQTGRSFSFIWGLCHRLGVPTRDPKEANRVSAPTRTKTLRSPFAGSDEDREYIRGFAEGDLDVRKTSSLAIVMSSTTTHPSFSACFRGLFCGYGPFYHYPVHDEKTGYRWKVAARLDSSFSFALPELRRAYPKFTDDPILFWSWLAGIVDTDGSIGIVRSGTYVRTNIFVANENRNLLVHIKRELLKAGFHPSGPYVSSTKGQTTSSRNIRYREDMLSLYVQRSGEVREILRLLPLRHEEKRLRRELVLGLPTSARWTLFGERIEKYRRNTSQEVADYVMMAEKTYKMRGLGTTTWQSSQALSPHRTS